AALVGSVAAVLLVFRYFDVAARPVSDRLNGGPATAHQGFGETLLLAISGAPIVSPFETPTAPAILLSLAIAGGLAAVVIVRREWWILAAVVAVVLLYAAAAGSNSDFAKILTGLWYKDKYRLISLLPVLAVPLVAVAVGAVARLAERY